MEILSTFREVVDLAQKAGQLDLYKRLVELQGEAVSRESAFVELNREKLTLEEKVRALEERLRVQKTLVFDGGVFKAEGDPHAYCPACWQGEGKLAYLRGPFSLSEGYPPTHFKCTLCEKGFFTPERGTKVF